MNKTNPIPTQQETLEPCPFCGSHEQPTVFGLKPDQWWVECSGYEGLCCKLFLSTTKEEAISKWNSRAAVAGPRGDVLTIAERVVAYLAGKYIDPETASMEVLPIAEVIAAATASPTPAESDGWVTFGRVKVDTENETETFQRVVPHVCEVPDCVICEAQGPPASATVAAPAESVTHRCPHCGRAMRSDFDEDVGMWYECDNCDYREAVSSAPAERTQVEGEQDIMTTLTEHPIAAHVEDYIKTLNWSPAATEDLKTFVIGNLRGFAAHLAAIDDCADIADKPCADKELTDADVDAFLREHENDPVDEAQLERVRQRFSEKLASDSARRAAEEIVQRVYGGDKDEFGELDALVAGIISKHFATAPADHVSDCDPELK